MYIEYVFFFIFLIYYKVFLYFFLLLLLFVIISSHIHFTCRFDFVQIHIHNSLASRFIDRFYFCAAILTLLLVEYFTFFYRISMVDLPHLLCIRNEWHFFAVFVYNRDNNYRIINCLDAIWCQIETCVCVFNRTKCMRFWIEHGMLMCLNKQSQKFDRRQIYWW